MRGREGEEKSERRLFSENDKEVHPTTQTSLIFLIHSLPMDKILKIGTVTSKLLENFMTVFIRLKIYQA